MKEGSRALRIRGTSFLAADAGEVVPAYAATFAGIGAFVFPSSGPWFVLLVLAPYAVGIVAIPNIWHRVLWIAFGGGIVFLALSGSLRPELAAAVLAAAALCALRVPRAGLAIAVLFLQSSFATTLDQLVSNYLFQYGIETAGPGIIACLSVWLVYPVSLLPPLALIGSLASGALNLVAPFGPEMAMTVTGLAAAGLSSLTAVAVKVPQAYPRPLFAFFALTMSLWLWTAPRTNDGIYVLLPAAPEAFEAQYFLNYIDSLHFAGIPAEAVSNPGDVPAGAVLLLPWLTSELPGEDEIPVLAREHGWTVILGGEHSDLEGVAKRAEGIVGRPVLRKDLTTPPGNTDFSGHLRSVSINAWPFDAALNRGASVNILSILDKAILSGDSWWAEPDIGEWLWAGNYIWDRGDRRGRLALAMVKDTGKARFLVVGDNSLFINKQVIANPVPVLWLVDSASLWPAFGIDMFLLLLALGAVVAKGPKRLALMGAAFPVLLLGVAVVGQVAAESPSKTWTLLNIGESGYDERNFNLAIAEEPQLWKSGWLLHRERHPVTGRVEAVGKREVLFALVAKEASVGGVRLRDCHRLGALTTDAGPFLMNAQSCEVEGDARILVGNKQGAAAIAVEAEGRQLIWILDIGFLSQTAPVGNRAWLVSTMSELSK